MAPDGADKPSIEDTMGRVFDAAQERNKSDAPEPSASSQSADTTETVEASGASTTDAAPPNETAAEKAERLRAEDGKFRKPTRAEKRDAKAATKDAATPTAGQPGDKAQASPAGTKQPATDAAPKDGAPDAASQTDQTPTTLAGVKPPDSWSAAAKAAFASAPPALQAAVARREQEVAQGFAQYEGIGRALAPMQRLLQMRGVHPAAYVNQMVQLDQALQNPATKSQAFAYLFQTYGYQPNQSNADNAPGASNPAAMSSDPTIATLQQQNQSIIAYINQQAEAQRAAQEQASTALQREASTEVDKFRNDPANEFFDLVRDDVRAVYERAAVLNQKAPTLAEAYEQAVWANPQTRPIMLARQTQKAEDDRVKAASDAAAKARKSQVPNLRGTNGVAPATPPGPLDDETMRAKMAAVYDRIHAA